MKRRYNGSESGEPDAEARRNAADTSAEFFESFEISEVSESAGTAESSESSESLKTSKSLKTAEQSKKPKKKSNALLDVLIAISAIFMIGAICLIAYPTFSDWWNRMHQSYAVASYVEQTEDLSGEEKQHMLDAAHAYNEALAANGDRWHLTDEQRQTYENTLDITGTGIMGYVTIPRIKVKLPVYHGTSEGVLQIAAGHLAGTSLPVGGETTHAVISGHTGLPSAKLLTGLDELQKGDTFAFHVLDETYTYQVDQISVVLPSDISKLNIESGKDYATHDHMHAIRGELAQAARARASHTEPEGAGRDHVRRAGVYDGCGGSCDWAARVDHWIRVRMAGTAVAARAHRESRSRGCRAPLVRQTGVVSLLPSRILPVLRRCDVWECTIAIIAR